MILKVLSENLKPQKGHLEKDRILDNTIINWNISISIIIII